MFRILSFAAAAACLLAAMPVPTVAQPKPKVIPAGEEQYALLARYTEMVGVIQGTSPGAIVLRVEYEHPKANNAANNKQNAGGPTASQQNQMARLQNDLQNAQRIANPAQRQQRIAQIQNQMQQLQAQVKNQGNNQAAKGQQQPQLVKDFIDYELPLTEKVVIRKREAGAETDDKGKSGFPGKFEDLSKGDEVKVYFAKFDPTVKKAAAPKRDENGAIMDLPTNRPRVREILIIRNVDGNVPDRKKKN